MNPEISILTCVYNGQRYIERCWECILAQHFSDWEWIVVDDGSEDGTGRFLRSLKDDRVLVTTLDKNYGRGFARSEGLKRASGNWIAIWDVDDIYFQDRLARQWAEVGSTVDFVAASAYYLDEQLGVRSVVKYWKSRFLFSIPSVCIHPSILVRRELLQKIGYDHALRAGEDVLLLVWLAVLGRGKVLDEPLMVYCERERAEGGPQMIREWVKYLREVRRAYKRYMWKMAELSLISRTAAILNLSLSLPAAEVIFWLCERQPRVFNVLLNRRQAAGGRGSKLPASRRKWIDSLLTRA